MKPNTIKSGRDGCERVVDVPKMIGRSGRMHGPAIVTTPARMANRKRVMLTAAYHERPSSMRFFFNVASRSVIVANHEKEGVRAAHPNLPSVQ